MKKPRLLTLAFAAAVGILPTVAAAADPARIPLSEAIEMAQRAQQAAAEMRLNIAIVVVNREGRVILSHRMDDASFINLEVAEAKARTSAATGAPTSIFASIPEGDRQGLLTVPGITLIGGGVPVRRSAGPIGGIGVSGGSPQQDEAIATRALGQARPQ